MMRVVLLVGALPGVAEMLADQFPESESLVPLPNQDQATVGGDSRSLEIDFEKSIESFYAFRAATTSTEKRVA